MRRRLQRRRRRAKDQRTGARLQEARGRTGNGKEEGHDGIQIKEGSEDHVGTRLRHIRKRVGLVDSASEKNKARAVIAPL